MNFSVTAADGYRVTGVQAKGNFKNLKSAEELGTENIYRLTKITGDCTVTVVTEKIETSSDTDTSSDSAEGYKVAFVCDNISVAEEGLVTVCYADTEENNIDVTYARNRETGETDTSGSGVVEFRINPPKNADGKYRFAEFKIEAKGKLGSIESLGDYRFLLTDIKGDVVVTIITGEEITDSSTDTGTTDISDTDTSEDTNSDANTDTSEDTNSDTNTDTSEDTNSDTNTDTSEDTNSDTDTDTAEDTNSDTDTDTSDDTNTGTDTDTNTDTNTDTDKQTDDTPKRMYGDVDGDGKVTAKDSMLIQRYVINLKQLDDIQFKAADVNADGKVTNKDALEILRYTINLSNNKLIGTFFT